MIPPRPAIARYYRDPLTRLESHIWLPRVPPVAWSLLGVAVSALAFAVSTEPGRAAVVAGALLADWLDGATARRYGTTGRDGYVRDVVADRVSEGLLFIADRLSPVGAVFLALWLLNVGLTVYSLNRNRHLVLPLRFVYLLLLLVLSY